MTYDDGRLWLKYLKTLEDAVDLVKAGHLLGIDTIGGAKDGYTQMVVDKSSASPGCFDNVITGFATFRWADEADDVQEATRRLLQKLYELRAAAPSETLATGGSGTATQG